jgi:hypothetical protein
MPESMSGDLRKLAMRQCIVAGANVVRSRDKAIDPT